MNTSAKGSFELFTDRLVPEEIAKVTIGVTTHQEAEHIGALLDALMQADESIPIIIYDDCSSDQTVAIMERHPLARRERFHLKVAERNHGGPAPGRKYIADTAVTEYVTLVDGDDLIDARLLKEVMRRVEGHVDMIITPYILREKKQNLNAPAGPLHVTSETITRLISGIGGRIYNRKILANSVCAEFIGRSEDARLNMNALLNGPLSILHAPDIPFYTIEKSRKSLSARQIRADELEWRVRCYRKLQALYKIDDTYLVAVRRNLRLTINSDPKLREIERANLRRTINGILKFRVARIVFLARDLSDLGGIPSSISRALRLSEARPVSYEAISIRNSGRIDLPRHHSCEDGIGTIVSLCRSWRQEDTVVVTANNILRAFPTAVRNELEKLPLVYLGSAQLAFMVQNSKELADTSYVESFKVARIISLSQKDIEFQRQLGIHGQVKGFHPVQQRATNTYRVRSPVTIGYVGRIDFWAKAADRLVDLIISMQLRGLPPLRVFTTNSRNSPDFERFLTLLEESGAARHCWITLNCSDTDILFSDLSYLALPSKQESFGNVILEAFSYGVPVVACSYAPGPSELIRHGENGYLLDEFSGEAVLDVIAATTQEQLSRLSAQAFESHRLFTDDRFFNFLEGMADEVVNEFDGNTRHVFPKLTAVTTLESMLESRSELRSPALEKSAKALLDYGRKLERQHTAILASSSWRILEGARRISRRLTGRRLPRAFEPRIDRGLVPSSTLASYIQELERRHVAVLESRSWRISAPFRDVVRRLKGKRREARFADGQRHRKRKA